MITQQDLLRTTMARQKLTRNAFAEHYGVTRRSLDAWLLPSSSPGFHKAPREIIVTIEDLLLSGLDQVKDIEQPPLEDGFDMIFESSGREILFPRVFFHATHHPGIGEGIPDWSTEINLDEAPLGKMPGWSTQTHLARTPPADSDPYWVIMTHHRSMGEATGFFDAAYALEQFGIPFSVGTGRDILIDRRKVNGEIFTLLLVPAQPIYPRSLFIFQGRRLTFAPSIQRWDLDFWMRIITDEGDILKMAPWDLAKNTPTAPFIEEIYAAQSERVISQMPLPEL